MHGLTHRALREVVLQLRSYGFWQLVEERALEALGVQDDARELSLTELKHYTDEATEHLLASAFQTLKCDRDTGLRLMGDRHVRMCAEQGFLGPLKRFAGKRVVQLLHGIRELHTNLERSFEHASLPFVTITELDDGGLLEVHYRHSRVGYAAFFEGALIAAAEILCGERLRLTDIAPLEGFTAAWHVTTVAHLTPARIRDQPDTFTFGVMHDAMVSIAEAQQLSMVRGHSIGLVDVDTNAERDDSSFRKHSTMDALAFLHNAMPALMVDDEAAGSKAEIDDLHSLLSPLSNGRRSNRESDPPILEQRSLTTQESYLDESYYVSLERGAPATHFMRTVAPRDVSGDWADPERVVHASEFWEVKIDDPNAFALSEPHCVRGGYVLFVSHVWTAPDEWEEVVSSTLSYAEFKANELSYAVKDVYRLLDAGAQQANVRCWCDKACVAQQPLSLRQAFLQHIEDFICISDELVVILTWHYFSRLWCLFEWACFLALKHPRELRVANEAILTPRSAPLFVEAIRKISVATTQCLVDADRKMLHAFILDRFFSEAAFETFAKVTAVAMLARSTARRAGRSGKDEYMDGWISLAIELRQPLLAAALKSATPATWRTLSFARTTGAAMLGVPPLQKRASDPEITRSAGPNAIALDDLWPAKAGAGRPALLRRAVSNCGPQSAAKLPRGLPSSGASGWAGAGREKDVMQIWQTQSWQNVYVQFVERWFVEEVEPVLLNIKAATVRPLRDSVHAVPTLGPRRKTT